MRLLIVLSLFLSIQANGQVGDIISGMGDLSGASGCGESCGDACAEGCLTGVYLNCGNLIASSGFYEGIAQAQRDLLDKKETVRRIISLDLSYHYGLNWDVTDSSFAPLYNSILQIPALKFNWGIFGLEYRFDRFSDNTGWLHNNDVLLNFNLVQQEKVSYRLGGGACLTEGYDYRSDLFLSRACGLASMGLDLFLSRERFCPSLDIRLASSGYSVERVELSPKIGVGIYRTKHLGLMVDLGYNFRRYNQSKNFHVVLVGLRCNIR